MLTTQSMYCHFGFSKFMQTFLLHNPSLTLTEEKPISGLGDHVDRPGVIYDWKTMVEMICGKGAF